jgi:hypothetical protein
MHALMMCCSLKSWIYHSLPVKSLIYYLSVHVGVNLQRGVQTCHDKHN